MVFCPNVTSGPTLSSGPILTSHTVKSSKAAHTSQLAATNSGPRTATLSHWHLDVRQTQDQTFTKVRLEVVILLDDLIRKFLGVPRKTSRICSMIMQKRPSQVHQLESIEPSATQESRRTFCASKSLKEQDRHPVAKRITIVTSKRKCI